MPRIRAVTEDQPAFAATIEQEIGWLKVEPAASGATASAAHSIVVDIAAMRRDHERRQGERLWHSRLGCASPVTPVSSTTAKSSGRRI